MNLGKLWLVCGALTAWAQAPEIARNGIVNAAGNTPSALVDSAIARGALVAIGGARLGAHPQDTSARISGPAGQAALTIVSVAPSMVTARVPVGAPLGRASLTVTVNGLNSPPVPVKVVAAQFGAYSKNGKGWGPGRIWNVEGAGRAENTVSHAAEPGQTLAISGTGLGDAKSPAVLVGGIAATVLGTRASPDGDEILFGAPGNAPEGCFVPIQVHNAGNLPSNTVTVAIHKGGGACREPDYFPFAGWPGARFGLVAISRTVERGRGAQPVLDAAGAWFGRLPGLDRLNPYLLLPPQGTCNSEVEAWRGEPVPTSFFPLLASHSGSQALQAGEELTINDGKTVRKIPAVRGVAGSYDRQLSDLLGRPDTLLRLVSPAMLHVAGRGGADVGAFSVDLGGVEAFEIRGEAAPIPRGQALRLGWADMGAGRIAIVVANFTDESTGSRGLCYCVGQPGAAGLTIPAAALAYFPPAGRGTRISVTVIAWPLRPVTFPAAGLDHGLAVSVFMQKISSGNDILPGR